MSSRLVDSAKACLNTQIAVDAGCASPSNRGRTNGLLTALRSDRNTAGYRQLTDSVANSRCKPDDTNLYVEVEIRKPNCGAPTGCVDLCGTGAPSTDPYLNVAPCVDMQVGDSISISKDDFCNVCETPTERMGTEMIMMAERLEDQMSAMIAEKAYSLMGNYASGTLSTATPINIPVINPNGTVNAAALAQIKGQFRKMKCNQAPIMVGGEVAEMIQDLRQLGGVGCCPENGRDVNAINSFSINYDSEIDSTLQALAGDSLSHILSWSPGALQLLEFWKNVGYHEEFKEDYSRTRILINGIWYDYTINYEKCNSTYTIGLCKSFGLFCIPDEAYQPCYDYNHKLHFTFGCGETACTDFAC